MKVLIVGLGGVGGYIAANFARNGIDVVGVVRGKHLEAIKQNGLTVVEDDKTYKIKLNVKSIDEIEGEFDLAIFCVKNYDLKEVAKKIKKHLKKDSIAISFANGVNNGDILREVLEVDVLDGCIYILSHIQSSGVIRKKGNVFAAVFGGEKAKVLAELFEKSNLRYKISNDIKKDIWKKYIFISAFANLTSFYDKSINKVYKENKDEAKKVLSEIAKVAKLKGIEIEKEIEKSLKTASNLPADATTSMHKDFKENKQTEIDTLTKYLLDEASKYGVELELLQKIYKELSQR